MNRDFWRDRRVFLTGHTGFKGSWLASWLKLLGAQVTGYALEPVSSPNLFEIAQVSTRITSFIGDVRNLNFLRSCLNRAEPEIVIHLAAQALVQRSYADPVTTYETNVTGTVNLLESVRTSSSARAVVVVTSDKCYENREWLWGYRESDRLGGHDPYSNSKACTELVTDSYRNSFFRNSNPRVGVSTARAGNVIGGGDWAEDRLIPDIVSAFSKRKVVTIRNPLATRPWQHVLEPLAGYLTLAERLFAEPDSFGEAWNFGPDEADTRPVSWVATRLAELWGDSSEWRASETDRHHEAHNLKLDCSKARSRLGWKPRLNVDTALEWVVEWYRAYDSKLDASKLAQDQIRRYETLLSP